MRVVYSRLAAASQGQLTGPLPVPGGGGSLLSEAEVHETFNRITGLIQQTRKCLAKPVRTYIFSRRPRRWQRSRGFAARKCGKLGVNPKA
jgi:hypothetical protein